MHFAVVKCVGNIHFIIMRIYQTPLSRAETGKVGIEERFLLKKCMHGSAAFAFFNHRKLQRTGLVCAFLEGEALVMVVLVPHCYGLSGGQVLVQGVSAEAAPAF